MDTLESFHCFDLFGRDSLSRLQPLNLPEPRDIKQNSPSHYAVSISSDVHQSCAPRGNRRRGFSVEKLSFVSHVAQRIKMGPTITMKLAPKEVSSKPWFAMLRADVMGFHHVMNRRTRVIRSRNRVDWQGKGYGPT